MDIAELIILAIEALRGNLIRTILTMLGVIIGIASVIVIVSLGEGATESIVGQFESFGANILTVSAGRGSRGPGSQGGTVDTLNFDDAEAIMQIPNVVDALGIVSASKSVVSDNTSLNNSITGVESGYFTAHDLTMTQGAFISDNQVSSRSKVIVMGDELVEEIFGENTQVVGETVRVDGKTFRIIGVVQDSSSIYAPISTVQKTLLSQDYLNSIEVVVTDNELVSTIEPQIESMLLLQHEIDDADDADFNIRSSQEMVDSISSVTGTLTTLLSAIAAISLVVGGIGIMNIMMVTVTERTKEIGLLKAIGAKKKDILTQFLIEAIVITLLGGAIGITLGIMITFGITQVISIPFIVSIESIVIALGVSAGVGILFGYYPAHKASQLNPIDALRYE